jgi:hypothetical protein
MHLPTVSGAQCAQALIGAGFQPIIGTKRSPVVFVRAPRAVVVPDVPLLEPETLESILRMAGLTPSEFLERLAADG